MQASLVLWRQLAAHRTAHRVRSWVPNSTLTAGPAFFEDFLAALDVATNRTGSLRFFRWMTPAPV